MDEQASSSTTSPHKRKFSEYYDPDYHNVVSPNNNGEPTSKRRITSTRTTIEKGSASEDHLARRCKVISDIITAEFDNEISLKKEQVELIDKRLAEARKLLDRLRYSIVADYYRKQEVPLTKPEADTIRGGSSQTLFADERAGPQLPLHPSLKKIIGKKPKSYAELLSTKPERSAAAQAKRTIRARNPALKKHERRMQQVIRDRGIVIDHSKEKTDFDNANIKAEPPDEDDERPSTSRYAQMKAQATADALRATSTQGTPATVLNSSRVNNKTKHYFVVGNTSKYIGADTDTRGNGQLLSHKWLVYVQGKDMTKPIEKYIKKVRFHLHHSYRPNDIVDVNAPPFQISRRGWGEFPMRIQLYFHDELQQKPVQLMHNLVLDKKQSGLHTLGAETTVEVWLRAQAPTPTPTTVTSAATINMPIPITTTMMSPTGVLRNHVTSPKTLSPKKESSKPRTISITHNKEELDDTLFAFLNKIDVSPDIEKIQPTVLVPEPLACKFISPSKQAPPPPTPYKQSPPPSTPYKQSPPPPTPYKQSPPPSTPYKQSPPPPTPYKQSPPMPKVETPKKSSAYDLEDLRNTNAPTKSPAARTQPHTLMPTVSASKPAVVYLPKISNGMPAAANNNQSNMLSSGGKTKAGNTIIVNGKKYMLTNNVKPTLSTNRLTMLPTSSAGAETTIKRNDNNIRQPTNINGTKWSGNAAVGTRTQKNIVFQKEGKLYIIDPLQMKLKQAQRKQESLLKPQVSLLKQKQTPKTPETLSQAQIDLASMLHSIASDHDYAPPPAALRVPRPVTVIASNSATTRPTIITVSNSMPPPMQTGKKLSGDALCMMLQNQRLQFEQSFHRLSFGSMRAAVEFLLRRLPMIAEPGTVPAAFPHASRSHSAFRACTVLKQRACESLRAKVVHRFMRNHLQLQTLAATEQEQYWTTREIQMFARFYAFTPAMKTFSMLSNTKTTHNKVSVAPFAALVQSELQQEEQQVQYETLTVNAPLSAWVDRHIKQLADYEYNFNDQQPIDVVAIEAAKTKPKLSPASSPVKSNHNHLLYLPLPAHLNSAALLVSDACKSSPIDLKANEEFAPGVLHPAALTAVSQALKIFVDKLLRQTIANKLQHQPQSNGTLPQGVGAVSDLTITPQDIVRVIPQCEEFDFLSNSHLGVTDCNVKQK